MTLLLAFLLGSASSMSGQFAINEIDLANNQIEIINVGPINMDASSFIFCSFPTYTFISSMTIVSGDLDMDPGEITVLSGHTIPGDFENDGELGLYINNSYGSSSSIIDYVEWGSTGHFRSSVAVGAGIWETGDVVDAPASGSTLAWDGEGDAPENWDPNADPTLGAENSGGDCEVEAAVITTADPTTICSGDGTEDPINVDVEGGSSSMTGWIITDADLNILGLPESGPIDLEGAPSGICLIWYINYEEGISGLEVDMNAGNLEGCYELSNSIEVNRIAVMASEISTIDPTEICAGDGIPDPINVTIEGGEGENSAWVITDADLNILGLPEEGPFDLDGAGPGVCLIWYLNFADGLMGAEVGMNAADLNGCYALSNAITVTRTGVSGATVETTDGDTEIDVTVGDGLPDVYEFANTSESDSEYSYIITESDGTILGVTPNTADFEGAGEGICLVYGASYTGFLSAIPEQNIDEVTSTGCLDISENSIVVNRTTLLDCEVNAGNISTESNTTVCSGDGEADVLDIVLSGDTAGTNMAWVLTDAELNILDITDNSMFDFDGAPAGVCLIWHISFEDGLIGAEVGMNAADLDGCFQLSNSIAVTRVIVGESMVSTDQDETEVTITVGDGSSDVINFANDSDSSADYIYIITDEDGNILGTAAESNDFEGAEAGICHVYGMSYSGMLTANAGMNISMASASNCFILSTNFITVNRIAGECEAVGGTISTSDETTICAGDGVADMIDVTVEGASASSSAWVITDEDLNILDLPAGPPFDFDGAGSGVCLIWHLSHEDDLTGATIGDNAADLSGCFELSNSIAITRVVVDGATVETIGGDTEVTVIVGDGLADEIVFDNTSDSEGSYVYVITDLEGNILGTTEDMNDFEGAEAGVCHVYGFSYTGELLLPLDSDIESLQSDGCYDLSDNFIEVTREIFDGVENLNLIDVSLYPTVTDNSLFVKGITGEFSFVVYDLTGKIVMSTSNRNGNERIDVSALNQGVYVMVVENSSSKTSLRFVKNN